MLAAAAGRPEFLPSWWGPAAFGPALGLVLGLIVFMRIMLGRPPKARAVHEHGRVIGFLGPMGSGKTYSAVRAAWQNIEAGADVYTNFTMHLRHEVECDSDCELPVVDGAGRWHRVTTMDEVAELRGEFVTTRGRKKCVRRFVCIIDEVQDLLSSDHGGLSDTARFGIKNIRKNGGDLTWTSQSEGGVHARLKALTNQYAVCSSFQTRKGPKFTVTYYERENLRKAGKELFTTKYRFDPVIGDLYDTAEIVVPDDDYVDERLAAVLATAGIGAHGRTDGRRRSPAGAGGTRQGGPSSGRLTTPRPAQPLVVGGTSEAWGRGGAVGPPSANP